MLSSKLSLYSFPVLQSCRLLSIKSKIDYSRVPKINENDLEEKFTRGHGPGGQNVNKTANCVMLRHIPTGTVIKCHQSRLLQDNRKLARELLVTKLDNLFNGDYSVENQLKLLNQKKSTVREQKRKKLEEMKARWKEREGIT